MLDTIKKEWTAKIALIFFGLVSIWWNILFLSGVKETFQNYLFGATYGLICIWGGVLGLIIASKWGGFSSTIGRALIILSLGLLTQEFGQLVFSYYNIFLHIEIPYPSLADIGFFGTIPFYIVGMLLLAKAAGAKFSLNTFINQLQALLIPVAMLIFSFTLFLNNYHIDFTQPLKTFLDFGYPLGEALYVSIAILTYSLSRKFLGGLMRTKILFFIVAFIIEYIADFNFLWQNNQGTWVNGGYGDYLYFLSYFIMALSIIQMKTVLERLNT